MNFLLCGLALIFVLGYGIASIGWPEEIIYLRHYRWFEDFEPTDRYILGVRIRGGFLAVFAIVMAIILIFVN